ncbi:hypothetical protein BM221_002150 [Beauveria bassiana]|uniref:Uncharacterized protein n=1 Tax=Beauveria bassiana TaxID=176275 RepID=A0A2N6NXP3_BEABA|nr:hypothetical protein BM221_002150 [Beauveria bassiana]
MRSGGCRRRSISALRECLLVEFELAGHLLHGGINLRHVAGGGVASHPLRHLLVKVSLANGGGLWLGVGTTRGRPKGTGGGLRGVQGGGVSGESARGIVVHAWKTSWRAHKSVKFLRALRHVLRP